MAVLPISDRGREQPGGSLTQAMASLSGVRHLKKRMKDSPGFSAGEKAVCLLPKLQLGLTGDDSDTSAETFE